MPPTGCFSSPRYISEKEAEQEVDSVKKCQKKLGKEDIDKSVQRLTQTRKPKEETGPVTERKMLPKDQMEQSVDRLYTQAVGRKAAVMESLERRNNPVAERKVLDQDAMACSIDRIYSQAMSRKKDLSTKLRSKMYSSPVRKETGGKKLSHEEQAECNSRAYATPMERKKETQTKLEEKYIASTQPQFKVMSKQEWTATVERLARAG
eukprot:TRINITY_DN7177_c0_g1_i1.p1 TRINITY_DN7177_c0_g1~~TRINITY_DN7177_c0_g1_i1.p1  ORF type:complete len:236 (+),score=86.10 TRINITY_DN7177_c0_g1_i1:88-708(+)